MTNMIPVRHFLFMLAAPLLFQMPLSANAQEPTAQEANRIFNYAETTYPDLFPSPADSSGEAIELGFRWFFRYYQSTDTFAAVNRDDGFVWALGPYFGPGAVQVMPVETALALIPSAPGGNGGGNTVGIISPGTGNCVALTRQPVGTRTVHLYTAPDASDGVEIRTETEVLVSTPTSVSTDSDIYRDGQLTLSSLSRNQYEIRNGLSYLVSSNMEEELFGEVSGIYNSQVTYQPARLQGPAEEYCEGQEWYAPGVTVTSTTESTLTGNTSTSAPISATTSRVESIDFEVISVPAGTFDTVKLTITEQSEGSPEIRSESWIEESTGTMMRSRWFEVDGQLQGEMELLEVSY